MFEKATRLKIRYPFKGMCTTEDLWDLSLNDLDFIYKTLNSKVKASKEESLLDERTPEDKVLSLQVSVIKHIVSVKMAERDEKAQEREKAAKKRKILELIDQKRDQDLQNKPIDELLKMVEELAVKSGS